MGRVVAKESDLAYSNHMKKHALVMLVLGFAAVARGQAPNAGWEHYGGDAGGARYSTAAQINKDNVGKLKVAWTYRTGALDVKTELIHKAAFEATPILVGDRLYFSTPYNHVIALDA